MDQPVDQPVDPAQEGQRLLQLRQGGRGQVEEQRRQGGQLVSV